MNAVVFQADEIRHAKCPICEGALSQLFRKSNSVGTFDIDRCSTCGFAFVNPTPSMSYIIDVYSRLGHGENTRLSAEEVLQAEVDDPNSSVDAERIAAFLKQSTGGGRLVDIGCGYGLFAAAAREKGFEIDAIEIASTERAVAKEILGFEPEEVSFEGFTPQKPYNAAILSQVLEHSREPASWIRKLYDILSPGGVASIAVPNFACIFTDVLKDKDPFVTPPTHLNYFSPGSLRELATRNGFEVLRIETVTRIPKRSFTRRLGAGLGLLGHRVFAATGGALDRFDKGVILNAYIRRPA